MVDTLAENPILLLFLVVGIGAAVGSIRIAGVSLGPAAALFVGLALSAYDERLALPEVLQTFGLAIFTYTIGLAAGPAFVAGMKHGGTRVVLVVLGIIGMGAIYTYAISEAAGLGRGDRAGVFAGTNTNTPALAAAIDDLKDEHTQNPTTGYSLGYPFGVISGILAAAILLRRGEVHPPAAPYGEPAPAPATTWTVEITRADMPALGDLHTFGGEPLTFGRYRHDGHIDTATADVRLRPGDLVTVVGPAPTVVAFCDWAGTRSDVHLPLDRRGYDFRRITISNRALAGSRVRDLDLTSRYGAIVTRVRRGDIDVVATDDLTLHLGDRVRVVGPSDRLPDVARVLGDSDRSLAEVDAIGFAFGIVAGALIGLISIPLPGATVKLGIGGGTLIAGLVLGVMSRVGPVTFQLPTSANLTLRQLGTLVFLACVGTRSGNQFKDAITTSAGVKIVLTAAVVSTMLAVTTALAIRFVLLRSPAESAGFVAGVQTQPAVLAFATQRTNGDERVSHAYAMALPIAMVVKIVLVQFLS
jgi:putative transport protein